LEEAACFQLIYVFNFSSMQIQKPKQSIADKDASMMVALSWSRKVESTYRAQVLRVSSFVPQPQQHCGPLMLNP